MKPCKRLAACAAACLISLVFTQSTACIKRSVSPPNPSGLTSVEQQVFADLYAVQTALEGLKENIALYPQLKPQLNQAIATYNIAEKAFEDYESTESDPAALSTILKNISDIQTQIMSIKQAFGEVETTHVVEEN